MVLRIGGLATGMDTDSLVKDLMRAERIPLDKLTQKKQTLEWQRDDYRDMNKLLNELDRNIFDGVLMKSSFTKKIVTSSNESAVTAKNISGTSNINTTIRVDQMAEAAYMNSAANILTDNSFDPDGKLVDERGKFLADFTSNDFSIQAIQSDGTIGAAVNFTIDPTTETLNSVINRINSSDAGVNVFYDKQTGRISMTAKNTGDVSAQAEIIITGDFFTASLDLDTDNIVAGVNGQAGKNAKFQINGLDTERTSNTFQINGYEYTLKQVTDDGDQITQAGEIVTFNSNTDTEQIFDTIVKFIDKYNETIDSINSKISEERFRDFPPLTDEQRNELSENEIELWEENAKSGMIRNDSILSSSMNQMRLDFYSPVTGINSNYDQLSEIGIKTSSNYLDRGKLIINEDELRNAISNDPMAIYDLFNKEVKDGNGKLINDQSGITRRLRETIDNTINNIEAKAGNNLRINSQFTIGRNLDSLNNDIADFEARLLNLENGYWKQFAAMEKAIDRYNSQFNAFMSQLGQ